MENKKEENVKLEFSKVTLWKGISLVLGILLIVSIYTGGFGKVKSASNTVVPTAAPTQPSGPTIVKAVEIDKDDHVKGDSKAGVTIVEFSDFQCPFCARFYSNTLPTLEEKYIKTGKAKLVFKDYPLPFHDEADEAALAAECAGEQDKYWEMHDKLFESSASWADNSNAVTIFKGFAKELKLSTSKFDKCLDDRKYDSEIKDDISDGEKAAGKGLGTPSFFIGNEKEGYVFISGAMPTPVFEAAIEQYL